MADVSDRYCEWLNDPEVTKYTEQRFYRHTKESISQYIKDQPDNVFFWAILIGKEHVGNIKLDVNRIHRRGEISLLIGEKKYWGKGYGTEAVELVVEFAFSELGLHKLTAGCYETNIASRRIFEKNGFVMEGIIKEGYFYDGKYIDALRFGRISGR